MQLRQRRPVNYFIPHPDSYDDPATSSNASAEDSHHTEPSNDEDIIEIPDSEPERQAESDMDLDDESPLRPNRRPYTQSAPIAVNASKIHIAPADYLADIESESADDSGGDPTNNDSDSASDSDPDDLSDSDSDPWDDLDGSDLDINDPAEDPDDANPTTDNDSGSVSGKELAQNSTKGISNAARRHFAFADVADHDNPLLIGISDPHAQMPLGRLKSAATDPVYVDKLCDFFTVLFATDSRMAAGTEARFKKDNPIRFLLDAPYYVPNDISQVMMADKPPSIHWFKGLPSALDLPLEILLHILLEYVAVLEKKDSEPIIYFGSASSEIEGAAPRMVNYVTQHTLGQYVMKALADDYELTHMGVMGIIPFRLLTFGGSRIKTWVKMLEAKNTYCFWSVHQSETPKPGMTLEESKDSHYLRHVCPWDLKDLTYKGANSHSPLREGVGNKDFTPEELVDSNARWRERRNEMQQVRNQRYRSKPAVKERQNRQRRENRAKANLEAQSKSGPKLVSGAKVLLDTPEARRKRERRKENRLPTRGPKKGYLEGESVRERDNRLKREKRAKARLEAETAPGPKIVSRGRVLLDTPEARRKRQLRAENKPPTKGPKEGYLEGESVRERDNRLQREKRAAKKAGKA
ncbi:Protein kinase C-like 1 [Cladophialophora chaetospira]|uniref:Protein kinase C-like 1 n=1 Tax=Cladophialophora chaetospira TaxID=386627 RepID=A0AA38X139_9EURO|nr:Protein kinase C-like 1 [Cladophialophora chaetospira]